MSNIPEGSKHPAVVAHRKALGAAREWLQMEGIGGAYAGTEQQVKNAMNSFHPNGWDAFKQGVVRA